MASTSSEPEELLLPSSGGSEAAADVLPPSPPSTDPSGPPIVHLGFATKDGPTDPFRTSAHQEWDGGKIGGSPYFLNPRDLPRTEDMFCRTCKPKSKTPFELPPLQYVLQIYAPTDNDTGPEAYHRMLYLYVCSSPGCGRPHVFRCQLPAENDFLSPNPDYASHPVNGGKSDPEAWGHSDLCSVCGLKSGGKKCPVQEMYFCTRAHQKEYMKNITKPLMKHEDYKPLPSIFQELCIEVEEQVSQGDDDDDDDKVRTTDEEEKLVAKGMAMVAAMNGDLDGGTAGDDDDDDDDDEDDEPGANRVFVEKQDGEEVNDAALDQAGLNDITGSKGVSDELTLKFLTTVKKTGQEQVLRYSRWRDDAPLWTASTNLPECIPNCERCGAERKFEFQIMPQLLYFLRVEETTGQFSYMTKKRDESGRVIDEPDKPEESEETKMSRLKAELAKRGIDWGTLAVYTCTKSCDAGQGTSQYMEEFAHMQPPI